MPITQYSSHKLRCAGNLFAKAAILLALWGESKATAAIQQYPAQNDRRTTPPGAVYNVTLLTDSSPDLTDVDSYLRSITAQFATPQEKAISIWRWSQRLRKQTSNANEDGHFVLDPILLFNSYTTNG